MGEQDPDKVKTAGAVILVLDHDITRLKNALLAEDIFSFTAALKEKKQSFLKGTYIKHYPEELIEQVSKLRAALNKKTDALAVTVDRYYKLERIAKARGVSMKSIIENFTDDLPEE